MTDHDKQAGPFKVGGELLPYHPQASHVSPDYRDGWNHCFAAMSARIAELERERDELRAREKACETIREAEMVALVRMAQGLCPMLGLDPLTASPSEIVAAAEALHAQRALVAEFVRDIGRAHGIQGKEG